MLKASSISHFQLGYLSSNFQGGLSLLSKGVLQSTEWYQSVACLIIECDDFISLLDNLSLQLKDLADSLNAVEARDSESFEMPTSDASFSIHLICLISS